MAKFAILLTRDRTESINLLIEAQNMDEAEDIAYATDDPETDMAIRIRGGGWILDDLPFDENRQVTSNEEVI